MLKRISAFLIAAIMMLPLAVTVFAASVPKADTPDYKVAFYAFDCYNMQDADGKRYGYGYELMQNVAKYTQCTFSYVGYDKTAAECFDMLENGELDIYTAAKLTDERKKKFAVSKHPAITASTYLNVKVSNTKVIAGDYSTYDGMTIGLLRRHTYNDKFLKFADEKGFSYQIKYYDTPTELSKALIDDEVDALVNSYFEMPNDERTVENFGDTPYYIMARKEDQALIDSIDHAIDCLNIETPNWRAELYQTYYGSQDTNTEYSDEEKALLYKMKSEKVVIRAAINPDREPYSWFENGEAKGIVADIFKATAEELGLDYEIVETNTRAEYEELVKSGGIDIKTDIDCTFNTDCEQNYKATEPYLTTTVSLLRQRGSSGGIRTIAVPQDNVSIRRMINSMWRDAGIVQVESLEKCSSDVLSGTADAALLMTYSAQSLAKKNIQNTLSSSVVPGAQAKFRMGVNASNDYRFYGLWQKALRRVSDRDGAEIVQRYIETNDNVSIIGYLYDHPLYLLLIVVAFLLVIFFVSLWIVAMKSTRKQQRISAELSHALDEAKQANEAKQNFFSKMSHDIRTPLNVVLGMTQVAQKYKHNPEKIDNALDNIASEGTYLLGLINSILDVNQLEYGHVELQSEPFDPVRCMQESADVIRTLAEKKKQTLNVHYDGERHIVKGDANRFSQIMINILSNAVKYTDNGGKIDVSLEYISEDRYRFICRDNGIGMTYEFIQHITEEYVRAEDSRVSKTQGTGLGMSVVKGFTELMGGKLSIESKVGEGSVFAVEIPFEKASDEETRAFVSPDDENNSDNDLFKGKKVLLVEDNALNAEIATELLSSLGLITDWADNGKKGTERFIHSENGEYLAIFMDMQMPVMDGIEATKVIRSTDKADKNIPIFAMTANTFASDKQNCMDAGMDGYISKPIKVSELKNALLQAVSEK